MRKKLLPFLLLPIICCLFLSGCWDYRGLDTLDIVTGIAVDKDLNSGKYLLTIEIIDTATGEKEINTTYVESQGQTFFDAFRNSKKRLIDRLYAGNLQTVIISKQIAKTEGVCAVVETLLRDSEPRETLNVVISSEQTAGEILLTEGLDSKIISYEIHEMVIEDSAITASTKNLPMYKIYEATHGTGNALVLPVVRCVNNVEKKVAEVNGIAIFNKDKLIDFDTPENTMLYLFIVNEVLGGVICLPFDSDDNVVTLEIKHNKTNASAKIIDDTVRVSLDINLKINIVEINSQFNVSDFKQRNELSVQIEKIVGEQVKEYFKYVQKTFKTDIFSFGNKIYQQNPTLWKSIENDWDTWFQKASIEVNVDADILTAGVIKNY